jgi:hypothetical protein
MLALSQNGDDQDDEAVAKELLKKVREKARRAACFCLKVAMLLPLGSQCFAVCLFSHFLIIVDAQFVCV